MGLFAQQLQSLATTPIGQNSLNRSLLSMEFIISAQFLEKNLYYWTKEIFPRERKREIEIIMVHDILITMF